MPQTKKLSSVRPQRTNANRHTPRGLGALKHSIQQDGWIGALTVAADGESFDGSARLEVGAAAGFAEAVIVESDGSRPVIVKRMDIPTADDPRAKRLGIAANRVASLNLDWDPVVLAELAEKGDLTGLWGDGELRDLLAIKPGDMELQKIVFGEEERRTGQSAASIGFEARIALLVPPEDYEVARKIILTLSREHPTWDVRFSR